MVSSDLSAKPESFLREVEAVIRPGKNRQMLARVRDHTVIMDLRVEMGGDNTAPTPGEFLMLTLGGCLFNLARLMAEEKQLTIRNLEVKVFGVIDLEKAWGLPTQKRAGYSSIDVNVGFESDAEMSEQEAFWAELIDRCPVCETIMNGVPIHFTRKYDDRS